MTGRPEDKASRTTMPKVSNFDGSIKSLGAWGGDMIMVTSHNNPSGYFKERGYSTIFKFEELLV